MHVSGGKIGRSHTTVIDHAMPVIKAAEKLSFVSRIIPGEIKQAGTSQVRYAVKEIDAGLTVTVRGPRTVQSIAIVTKNRKGTLEALEKVSAKSGRR